MSTPRTMTVDEATVELLGHQQAVLGDVRAMHRELLERASVELEPAQLKTVLLTAAAPIAEDLHNTEKPSLSLGILNPNALAVAVGLSGGSATLAARAVIVPANSLLVLPVAVAQLEIGADPVALGAGTAVVFLLRFPTVQPAFLGKAA
jgi:hypothetical protein